MGSLSPSINLLKVHIVQVCDLLVKARQICRVILPANPLQSPVSLLLDTGHSLDGTEQVVLLLRVFDVGVDQQTVHL